jgi:hypothetical protein
MAAQTRTPAARAAAAAATPATSDLREAVGALRGRLHEEFASPPPRDRKQSAVLDAWRAIVKPRLGDVLRRLSDLELSRRWELDGEERAVRLLPSEWDHVVRQIVSPCHARLAGALSQYHTARVVWAPPLRLGVEVGTNAPVGTKKEIEAQRKAAATERGKAERATRESYRATVQAVLAAFAERREGLTDALRALQRITASLQAAEEARLRERLASLAEDSPIRRQVRRDLQQCRELRLDAAAFPVGDALRGEAAWGGLLRRWLAPRRRASGRFA